jgi:penicillin-binding protein 1C
LASVQHGEVCAVSGMIPGAHCPRTHRTAFIAGVSPIVTCDVHVQVLVDDVTGERACPGEDPAAGQHLEVYELWPSNIARVFERAGLRRRVPPKYASRCKLDDTSSTGKPPRITSPQSVLTYSLRIDDPRSAVVPFAAVTGADARDLRWFVDDRYVGHASAGETFMWQAHPGNFVVRAVDDNGRADSQQLLVERVE